MISLDAKSAELSADDILRCLDRNAGMKIEISRKSDDEALAFAEASRRAMARLMAVAGHDLKQPLQVAMLSITRAVGQGVTPAAGGRLRIALDALRRATAACIRDHGSGGLRSAASRC